MNLDQMKASLAQRCDPQDKIILIVLAFHANAEGWAWPKIAGIQAATGLSRRTIQRRLEGLRRRGWILWTARSTASGRQTSNCYRVLLPVCQKGMVGGDGTQSAPATPSGVSVTASPLEVAKEIKRIGVSSGKTLGARHLQRIQQRLRGNSQTSQEDEE